MCPADFSTVFEDKGGSQVEVVTPSLSELSALDNLRSASAIVARSREPCKLRIICGANESELVIRPDQPTLETHVDIKGLDFQDSVGGSAERGSQCSSSKNPVAGHHLLVTQHMFCNVELMRRSRTIIVVEGVCRNIFLKRKARINSSQSRDLVSIQILRSTEY